MNELLFIHQINVHLLSEKKGENKQGVPKYWLHMSEKDMNLIQKSKHTGRVLTHKQIGVQYLTFTSCDLSNTVQGIFESAGIKTELE